MSIPMFARDLPGLERRTVSRSPGGDGGARFVARFFVGTDVGWGDLIDRLEGDQPSSPAAFLAEYPEVSYEQLLGVLRGMAEAMAYVDAWKALRLVLNPGPPKTKAIALEYFHERLARRAVVEAWRDEMIAAEETPGIER